ncbi:Cell adhesion molecule 2 [Takifugu flavidus]|uniref:Cell adhesion molecule 2 n=1 Tax=Takifugu flavidus TaxID=433684 RepID=A0A5C6P4Z2_9TELE|nr:Cell adhesion molecule 2 [Takifugu flavidus]
MDDGWWMDGWWMDDGWMDGALRDNRIELVHASWSELTISINDVTLSDEGMYTCSLFTMPVRTAKAYLTVLGVPEKPQINGLLNPALEGDHITLTCITQGSKPAADLRWFRNEKEIKDFLAKHRMFVYGLVGTVSAFVPDGG